MPGLSDYAPTQVPDGHARQAIHLLSSGGGDERITLDPATGLNRYHSGPYPRTRAARSPRRPRTT